MKVLVFAFSVALWVAVFPMPYDYYTFLRVFISFAGVILAVPLFNRGNDLWVLLVFVVVLFNPIFPVYLAREIWLPIDIAVSGIFLYVSLKFDDLFDGDLSFSRPSRVASRDNSQDQAAGEQPSMQKRVNTEMVIKRFDANAENFRRYIRENFDAQIGDDNFLLKHAETQSGAPLPLEDAIDALCTALGLEAALAVFFTVFQEVLHEPGDSETFSTLRVHLSHKKAPDLSDLGTGIPPELVKGHRYVTEEDFQKIRDLANDPRYAEKSEVVRVGACVFHLMAEMGLARPDIDPSAISLFTQSIDRMRGSAFRKSLFP